MQHYTAEEHARAQAMAAEVQGLRARGDRIGLCVDVELFDLFRAIGALQLAWRHPGMDADMRAAIERFARQLQSAFDQEQAPELARTLEQGWHTEFDR